MYEEADEASTDVSLKAQGLFSPTVEPPPSTWKLFKNFIKLAVPIIITNMLSYMSNLTLVLFSGRMEDPINVAVVGLGVSFSAVLMLSFFIGLNVGQESLTSQAYGAGDYRLTGLYLNRGALILLAGAIPLTIVPLMYAE